MPDPVDDPLLTSGSHEVRAAANAATAHVLSGRSTETLPSVARAAIACGGAVAIALHNGQSEKVQIYALGVLLLVASPSLARAIIAPLLAFLLKR